MGYFNDKQLIDLLKFENDELKSKLKAQQLELEKAKKEIAELRRELKEWSKYDE